jgi:ribosomal protein L35
LLLVSGFQDFSDSPKDCQLLKPISIIMPKLKTHKATAKRFTITKKTKKVKARKAGQDHFNARESGKTKRNKRRDITFNKNLEKTIKKLISK